MLTFHKPFSFTFDFRYVKMTRKVEVPSKAVSRLKAAVSFCVCFYAGKVLAMAATLRAAA